MVKVDAGTGARGDIDQADADEGVMQEVEEFKGEGEKARA